MDDAKRSVMVAALSAYSDLLEQHAARREHESGKGKSRQTEDDVFVAGELQSELRVCEELKTAFSNRISDNDTAGSLGQGLAEIADEMKLHRSPTALMEEDYEDEPYLNLFTGKPAVIEGETEAGPSTRSSKSISWDTEVCSPVSIKPTVSFDLSTVSVKEPKPSPSPGRLARPAPSAKRTSLRHAGSHDMTEEPQKQTRKSGTISLGLAGLMSSAAKAIGLVGVGTNRKPEGTELPRGNPSRRQGSLTSVPNQTFVYTTKSIDTNRRATVSTFSFPGRQLMPLLDDRTRKPSDTMAPTSPYPSQSGNGSKTRSSGRATSHELHAMASPKATPRLPTWKVKGPLGDIGSERSSSPGNSSFNSSPGKSSSSVYATPRTSESEDEVSLGPSDRRSHAKSKTREARSPTSGAPSISSAASPRQGEKFQPHRRAGNIITSGRKYSARSLDVASKPSPPKPRLERDAPKTANSSSDTRSLRTRKGDEKREQPRGHDVDVDADADMARKLASEDNSDIQIQLDQLLAITLARNLTIDDSHPSRGSEHGGDNSNAHVYEDTTTTMSIVDAQDMLIAKQLAAEMADKDSLATAQSLQDAINAQAHEEESLWEEWKAAHIAECTVCGDESHREELIWPCEHAYCDGCASEGFRTALKSRAPFRCCGKDVPVSECHALPRETVDKYASLLVELKTTNPIYCHQPKCGAFVPPDLVVGDLAKCAKCNAQTCRHCRKAAHPGKFCKQDKETEAVKELAQEKGWKSCPGCQHMVERLEGCLHIVCSRCQTAFCYRCSKKWDDCESTCPDRTYTS